MTFPPPNTASTHQNPSHVLIYNLKSDITTAVYFFLSITTSELRSESHLSLTCFRMTSQLIVTIFY